MMCIGKIRNSLTIVEFLSILCISWLTNPRSPIRGFLKALSIDGIESSDFRKKKYYVRFVGMYQSNGLLYQMVDIRLTGCAMVQI